MGSRKTNALFGLLFLSIASVCIYLGWFRASLEIMKTNYNSQTLLMAGAVYGPMSLVLLIQAVFGEEDETPHGAH